MASLLPSEGSIREEWGFERPIFDGEYELPKFKPGKGGRSEADWDKEFRKLNWSILVDGHDERLIRLSHILKIPTSNLTFIFLNKLRLSFNKLYRKAIRRSIRRNPRISEFIVHELLKHEIPFILGARDLALLEISNEKYRKGANITSQPSETHTREYSAGPDLSNQIDPAPDPEKAAPDEVIYDGFSFFDECGDLDVQSLCQEGE